MAVDTRSRRASCIGLAMAPFLVLPNPNGAISPDDREQTAYCYLIPGLPRVVPCADLSSYVCDEPEADWDDQGGTQPPGPPTPAASTFKASVPIQMCPTYMYGAANDARYRSSEREIDPSDYDGLVAAWFEVVGWSYDPYDVLLVDDDGTEYARVTLAADYSTSHRGRVQFTLNPAKTKYYFKTLADPIYWGSYLFRKAEIILDVENSKAVRVQIPMLDGDQSTSGVMETEEEADYWAFNWTIHSTTYAYGGSGAQLGLYRWAFRPFKLTKANWQKVDHWTLEIIGLGGVQIALFNRTKNVMVAGAEVRADGVVPTRAEIDFLNDAVNFDDGDYFEVKGKVDSGWAPVYSVNLYCKLIELAKAEIHQQVGYPESLWLGEASTKYLHESGKYPASAPWYFEQAGAEWGDGHAFTGLVYCGQTDTDPEAQLRYPTVVSGVSGTWTDPNNIKAYDGADAVLTIDKIEPSRGMTLSGFNFNPAGFTRPITYVAAHLIGVSGIPEKLTVDAEAGGVTESHLIDNIWFGTPPTGVALRYVYDFSFDRPWVASDFASLSVGLTIHPPTGADQSTFISDFLAFTVGSGQIISELDYSIPTDGRYSEPDFQRSVDIASLLVDDGRYIHQDFNDVSNGTVSYNASSFLVGVVSATYTPANPGGGGGPEEPPPCVEWGDCTEPIGEMVEYAN